MRLNLLNSCNFLQVKKLAVREGLSADLQAKFLFLWTGDFDGDNLANDLDTDYITVNSKDFATDYIPATSSATFNVPNTSPYQNADTDYLWYDGGVKHTTVAEMIAADHERSFIKYDDQSPHHIRAIGILKSGESLTQDDEDELTTYFWLSFMYFGEWNDNGYLKENR